MLTSIFVTLTVPSYFLLVAMIEVTPPKRLFSLMRRQVLTSVSVTSTVPSYFLFSCDDRSYTAQASFLINMIRMLAGAFNAEETCFL